MITVTPRTKGMLKSWLVAYGCCVVLTVLSPWMMLSFMISFIVLAGSMIIMFGVKQSALISHVQQRHPERWSEMNSTRWLRGVREFYDNSEYFDDPELEALKLDYQSVESWSPCLPLGAVFTIIVLAILMGKT